MDAPVLGESASERATHARWFPDWFRYKRKVFNEAEFTRMAWEVLTEAEKLAEKHKCVGVEHVMMALLLQNFGRARSILQKTHLAYNVVLQATDECVRRLPEVVGESGKPSRSSSLENLITQAKKYRRDYDDSLISVEHLLLAYTKDDKFGKPLYARFKISEKILKAATSEVRGIKKVLDPYPEGNHAMLAYGKDLTALAREGKLNCVTGRANEIDTCCKILTKRTKCNLILVGKPGVGKTAIVEGLAQRIVTKEVADELFNCQVISLDLVTVIADASTRGEYENRFKGILKEAEDSKGQIIIFIDEIHMLVGAGAAKGSMDASNIMKPMLDRGEIRCIGATTLDDYRRYIEKDTALERRFDKVNVEQPSVEDTISILQGCRENFEQHYGIQISEDALIAAVELSDRYIVNRFLPDKAINLVDEAASAVKMRAPNIRKEIVKLEMEVKSLENVEVQDSKDKLMCIESNLYALKQKLCVGKEDIANVLSEQTKIPTSRFLESNSDKTLQLVDNLKKRIVGQDVAVRAIATAAKRWMTGFSNSGLPIGCFILFGPTGVGKTELAKSVASCLFGSEEALITFDMSAYKEKHDASRFFGAPPGYVGYADPGQLTEKVRNNPYSVILLDEIEKADSNLLDVFLPMLGEGRLTDSHGVDVDFKNTLIIMTSNMGANTIVASADDNYKTLKEKVISEAIANGFRKEFMGRNEVVIFRPLDHDHAISIAKLKLKAWSVDKKVKIEASDAAIHYLVDVGFEKPEDGARELEKAIQNLVVNVLSEMKSDCLLKVGDHRTTVFIDVDDTSGGGGLVFKVIDGVQI